MSSEQPQASLLPQLPPPWATEFGQDRRGIYGKFALEKVEFALRWIPPGTFMMGSPEDEPGRFDDEEHREVWIHRGFWILETPVTQGMWLSVASKNPSSFEGLARPVESVSWEDCGKFVGDLNQRIPHLQASLPTEAQWEYSCRAGTGSAFSDGSPCTEPDGKDPALEKLGWYGTNSGSQTHPVGEKEANGWGLYDMHGNVWEWCQDETDEFGDSAVRVVRGGSWIHSARYCRSAYRGADHPEYRNDDIGFRLVAGQEFSPEDKNEAAGGRTVKGE